MIKYKHAARIKEPISAVGLGCWAFAGENFWGERSRDDASIGVIRTALDNGINLLDVAPAYGQGHSETVVGKAIKGYDRGKFLIASKCGLLLNKMGYEFPNLRKETILREIDDSLRRLDTDYIDIYQLHWPDPATPVEETAEAIRTIMDAGKIRYFGVTNFGVDDAEKMEHIVPIASQQALYNMLESNPRTYHSINLVYRTERETLPYCERHGQAFFPYSPLMQGLLGGHWKADRSFADNDVRRLNPKLNDARYQIYYEAMVRLREISERYGHPLNETAVNWLIQKPVVTSVIGSCLSPEQVETNVAALEWEIGPEMMAEIDKVLEPFENM